MGENPSNWFQVVDPASGLTRTSPSFLMVRQMIDYADDRTCRPDFARMRQITEFLRGASMGRRTLMGVRPYPAADALWEEAQTLSSSSQEAWRIMSLSYQSSLDAYSRFLELSVDLAGIMADVRSLGSSDAIEMFGSRQAGWRMAESMYYEAYDLYQLAMSEARAWSCSYDFLVMTEASLYQVMSDVSEKLYQLRFV